MTTANTGKANDTSVLDAVIALAKTCESEYEHVTHVAYLTLRLFDELQTLHNLGAEDRLLLEYAAILHDIGWVEGWKNHHKAALKIILETHLLPFTPHERLIVGSIARYHRKSLPVMSHDHFASMNLEDRKRVQMLSSFLRLADGLDRTHRGKIRDLVCKPQKSKIKILCTSAYPALEEVEGGYEKADLLSLMMDKEILIKITHQQ
jgi:exopolyphosphatase/guanosine-5'-triphosphate,3'-diphosphate pyrophosphatase